VVGGTVTCTVEGKNADGTPEASTANNARSRTF
jgi:hypothetical protein